MLIDFHAHILPGCDHGSDSLETSLHQLSRARSAGIGTIVATPHFYMQRHTVDSFLERRERCYQTLLAAVDDTIQIVKACEVTLSYDLASIPNLDKLCIGDTNYILMEMPGYHWSHWVADSIYKISSKLGLHPIIAHIDRYDPKHIDELLDLDVLFQLNASALMPLTKRGRYLKMVRQGLIHVLGSDAHGIADEYDDYSKAVKLLKNDMSAITENSKTILRGELL